MFNLIKKKADNFQADKAEAKGGDTIGFGGGTMGDETGMMGDGKKSPKLSHAELHLHHSALASHYRHIADTGAAKEEEVEALVNPAEEASESPQDEMQEKRSEVSIGLPRQEGGSLRNSTPKGHAASRFDNLRKGRGR